MTALLNIPIDIVQIISQYTHLLNELNAEFIEIFETTRTIADNGKELNEFIKDGLVFIVIDDALKTRRTLYQVILKGLMLYNTTFMLRIASMTIPCKYTWF